MIILPEGTFTVIPDEKQEKTKAGIILDTDTVVLPDTGVVAFTSEDLKKYQGTKVRFRIPFAEMLEIEGVKHLYFRDFNSSIYYIIENEDKRE